MDDLTGKISKLLEDPEIMKSISGLSQMLQNDNSGSEPQNEEKNSENNSDDILSNFSIQPEMMDAILKIMPILSSIKKEDKYTMFLKSQSSKIWERIFWTKSKKFWTEKQVNDYIITFN